MAYMYILECSDKSFYTGSTINLEKRLFEHQSGEGANYTKKRRPVKLIYFEECNNIADAFAREQQIKGWSRKKKIAFIQGKYEELPSLSRRKIVGPCGSINFVLSLPKGSPTVEGPGVREPHPPK